MKKSRIRHPALVDQMTSIQHHLTLHHSLQHHRLDLVKIPTGRRRDILVNLRHEKNETFLKSKNHSTLWKDITAQLKDTLYCIVTPNQAMNKYYSLKKRWKEVVDAPTGTERKYFRQKEQFDEIYGTRESTKPTITLRHWKKTLKDKGLNSLQSNLAGIQVQRKDVQTCWKY